MSNANTIRIIAAVVDTRNLTLFLEGSGEELVIAQGDPRVPRIVEYITPLLIANPGQPVEVSLANDIPNEFTKFEDKAGGVVKFFRVTKKAIGRFFGRHEDITKDEIEAQRQADLAAALSKAAAITLGKVPAKVKASAEALASTIQAVASTKLVEGSAVASAAVDNNTQTVAGVPVEKAPAPAAPVATRAEREQSAVAEIMKHAVSVQDTSYNDSHVMDQQDKHTLIAVVGDKVVPNVQALRTQVMNANQEGHSPTALANFLKRAASVKRVHSVDDLMTFMKRADLPIAEDGCIVIYKILTTGKVTGFPAYEWVDCHSRGVPQRIGSYVCMDADMVDPNRRNECSNGLHVARRQYLNNFSGNVMVLAKVAPEDVIAVPEYDANKMRVCGYHILFKISTTDAANLRSNRRLTTEDEASRFLARALAGDHVARLEEVRITGSNGSGIKVKSLASAVAEEHEAAVAEAHVEAAKTGEKAVAALDEEVGNADPGQAEPVNPVAVAKTVSEAVEAAKPAAPVVKDVPMTRSQQANILFQLVENGDKVAAVKLVELKKTARQSWIQLGLTAKMAEEVMKLAAAATQQPQTKSATVAKQKPAKAAPAPKAVVIPAKSAAPAAGPSARIAALLPIALSGKDGAKTAAESIFGIKKAAKKNWDKLGVSDAQLKKLQAVTKK